MSKFKEDFKDKLFTTIYVKELFYDVVGKYIINKSDLAVLFADVLNRYSEKHRYYHTMDHIFRMCGLWEVNKSKLRNPDAIFLAIIYHDIIYKPRKNNNEEASAFYFKNKISSKLNLPINIFELVSLAIIITKHDDSQKELIELNKDFQYLLDFDLEILGTRHESEYEWYRKGVRKEYKIYPNFLYKPGRKKVLESFLSKKRIYLTEDFKIIEKNARKNLKNEINLYLCGHGKKVG